MQTESPSMNEMQTLDRKTLLKKRTMLLEEFLSKNGITIQFSMKVKEKFQFTTIAEYVEWLHMTKFNFQNAFYLAFYWHPQDPVPWKEHSQNWKSFLNGGSPYGPA